MCHSSDFWDWWRCIDNNNWRRNHEPPHETEQCHGTEMGRTILLPLCFILDQRPQSLLKYQKMMYPSVMDCMLVALPPNSYTGILTPHMLWRNEALGCNSVLSVEPSWMRSAPCKRVSWAVTICPLLPWVDSERMAIYQPRGRTFTTKQCVLTLILDFPTSTTMGKNGCWANGTCAILAVTVWTKSLPPVLNGYCFEGVQIFPLSAHIFWVFLLRLADS